METNEMKKYHIEKNTVQETLIIPLYGRKVCSDRFPGAVIVFDACNQRGAKSYMRGYRDIYKDVSFFHKLMIRFCDSIVKMVIVKIEFR